MKEPLHIHIPEPCHENWADMKPDEKGRFCLSCQKTVVDFTYMTDRQVLEYFSNYTGSTCGRFLPGQLNRDIKVGVQKPNRWYKYVLNFFVPALFLANKAVAQGRVLKKDTIVCTPGKAASQTRPDEEKIVTMGFLPMPAVNIEGQVVDENGTPIPNAFVIVKGRNQSTLSGVNGNFYLKAALSRTVTLVISSVGYETKEVRINTSAGTAKPVVVLATLHTALTGEVVVVGRIKKKQPIFHKFNRAIADRLHRRSLVLYPNAARTGSVINISYKLDKGNYFIRVFSITGQVLQEERLNIDVKAANTSFRLHNTIIAGQYVVAIFNDKGKRVTSGQLTVQ